MTNNRFPVFVCTAMAGVVPAYGRHAAGAAFTDPTFTEYDCRLPFLTN